MGNATVWYVGLDVTGTHAAKKLAGARHEDFFGAGSLREIEDLLAEEPGPFLIGLDEQTSHRELTKILDVAHIRRRRVGFIDCWRGVDAAERHVEGILSWEPKSSPGITFWSSQHTIAGSSYERPSLTMVDHRTPEPAPYLVDAHRTVGVVGHGNGADAPFGDGILCGLLTASPERSLVNYFSCGLSGECVRGKMVNGELVSPERHSTADFGGDIIVWGTCYGALAADSVLDPRGGLLAGFLERAGGAPQVITTTRATALDTVEILGACARIEAGWSLGDVVMALNDAYLSASPSGTVPPWILFGDPVARVSEDRSVRELRDGSMARPGLSLFRRSRHSDQLDSALVFRLEPDSGLNLWARPLSGGSEGLVLWRRENTEVELQEVFPAKKESAVGISPVGILDCETEAVEQISFSDVLFQLAAHGASGTGAYRYDPTLASDIRAAVQRLAGVRSSKKQIFQSLSGGEDAFGWAFEQEVSQWRDLNDRMFSCLRDLSMNISGVIRDHYAHAPIDMVTSSRCICPYCDSPAEETIYQVYGSAGARTSLQCGRCTVVSDSDQRYGPVILAGPERVTQGCNERFIFECTRVPDVGICYARAEVTLQSVPGMASSCGGSVLGVAVAAVSNVGARKLRIELDYTPPATARPGRYIMLAPAIVDGAALVARRSILIAPRP